MRGRAGVALVAAAAIAVVAFATSVFGAGASRPATVDRSGATTLHVHFAGDAAKSGGGGPKTIYGTAQATLTDRTGTVTLGKCPGKSHVLNGSLAALHADQAMHLTINGSGVAGKKPKGWFVDYSADTDTIPNLKAVGFIICQK